MTSKTKHYTLFKVGAIPDPIHLKVGAIPDLIVILPRSGQSLTLALRVVLR